MLIAFAYSLQSLLDHMSSYIQLIWDILLSVSALYRWHVYDICCHGYSPYGRKLSRYAASSTDHRHILTYILTLLLWKGYTNMEIIHGMVCFIDPQYTSMVIFTSRGPSTRASSPIWTIKVSSNLSYSIYYISHYVYAYCQGYSFKIVLLMYSYWVCR